MLAGLEVTVAKAAGTAALRAVASTNQIIRRSLDRRYLDQQLDIAPFGSDIQTLMAKLTPEAARDIELLASPEIANFALSIATDALVAKCGRKSNRISEELKQQLSRLLLLKTCLNKTEADSAAALLFTAMTSAVINNISGLLGDSESVPLPVKAALLKVQESYISAAVRNSALLAQITDLARYKEFEDQLKLQIRNLYGTMRLPHAGTSRRVPYEKLYVEATVDFIEKAESAERIVPQHLPIRQLANQALRIVLLRDPGGGKSTLSLKLAYDTASGSGVAGTTTPLLIVLREYASDFAKNRVSLIEYISKICQSPLGLDPPEGAIEYLLLNGRALVIFDGLDELLDTALRRQVVDAVTGFAFRYPTTPILVTSRRVGYADAPLDPEVFTGVSLQEFSLPQVRQYVTNWLIWTIQFHQFAMPISENHLLRIPNSFRI